MLLVFKRNIYANVSAVNLVNHMSFGPREGFFGFFIHHNLLSRGRDNPFGGFSTRSDAGADDCNYVSNALSSFSQKEIRIRTYGRSQSFQSAFDNLETIPLKLEAMSSSAQGFRKTSG